MTLERLKKGDTPVDAQALTATTWAEFEPDKYDAAADGNDAVHSLKLDGKIPQDKLEKAKAEAEEADSNA